MDDMMRAYVDAKVDSVKAQNDARFAEVIAGIDKIGNIVTSQGDILRVRLDAIDAEVAAGRVASQRAEDAAKGTKWNIFFTGLTVVGVLVAMWAIWAQGIELVVSLFGPAQR